VARKDNDGKRATLKVRRHDKPNSPARRAFIVLAGTSAGATLLGGLSACGSSDTPAAAVTPPVVQDPIWGTSGAATQIIASLQRITQSMFPSNDFVVTQ